MENRFADMIQPECLRSPEVIIGADWDVKADIWNLGCLVSSCSYFKAGFDDLNRYTNLPEEPNYSIPNGKMRSRG